MPIYEYRAREDGATIELIRPAARADDPVDDPEAQGRTFERVLSTFASRSDRRGAAAALPQMPGCPCGDPNGPCRG